MSQVHEMARKIVAREGGFVNDPDYPGGATNFGVTIGTMRRLGLDLNRDGRIDTRDVATLTADQAVDIYVEHYFVRPRIAQLPLVLHASVFDMYVNAGGNAIRVLQRLLTRMGFSCQADGSIGPATISAAKSAFDQAPLHLADAYGIARRNYYYSLGDRRPASRKYCLRRDGGKGGWIVRAEEFITPKYHLTLAQHRQRVGTWV